MGAELLRLEKRPLAAAALDDRTDIPRGIVIHIKGLVRVFFQVLVVCYHLLADQLVMLRAQLAVRIAAGVCEYLYLLLVRQLFKHFPVIVEVVVENDYVIVLFKFLCGHIRVGDTLAGRACQLIVGVCPADIVLKERRIHDSLIETVICKAHYHVTERVV